MANKMLIDAAHPEETRVVVLRGDRVEEFDFESALRKQLRGNIYLAKVTRVEPSLQAAFVDYGGNRHGFLAFNEIHPDYYQLPKADREALLEVEAEEARLAAKREAEAENARLSAEGDEASEDNEVSADNENDDESSEKIVTLDAENNDTSISETSEDDTEDGSDDEVESVGSEDALEELPERQALRRKHYKIQEVIKRRQIILVQVVKEERGNKGAALTTYLSLAGRYTVLMPNTARGGGISRKIANPTDRKRLRKIVGELEVPEGMGLIVRTAGASRTKAELKRDFEYLLRLWENVRDHTLQSSAPNLVYEEGNLIKRSIRDLYSKEVEEVLVAGEEEYREAKDFMRMLMPSHAKNVQPFKDSEPLFTKYKIESQLNAMYSPYVTLPSGGYIVINQTEALVSIDVNSGRSTKEHSIEETALNTNLEAATEISRQLRLRDLAGLVVIDFIDMEERRNNRAVERRIKECLRHDRARIQVGRISHFGLLEMSRQRLRTGVLEGSTSPCPHCQGTGMIRSTESMALTILRALEDRLLTQRHSVDLACNTNVDVALYILNKKRNYVNDIERRYGVNIAINASSDLEGVSYTIEQMRRDNNSSSDASVVQMDWAHKSTDNERTPNERGGRNETSARDDNSEQDGKSRRRRRRRGGQAARRAHTNEDQPQNENENSIEAQTDETQLSESQPQTTSEAHDTDTVGDEDARPRRPRRRGKRGGRRRGNRANREAGSENQTDENNNAEDTDSSDAINGEERAATSSEDNVTNARSNDKATNDSDQDQSEGQNQDSSSHETSSQRPRRTQRRPRRRSNRTDRSTEAKTEETNSSEAVSTEVTSSSKESTEAPVKQDRAETQTSKTKSSEKMSSEPKQAPKQGYWSKARQQKSDEEKTSAEAPAEKKTRAPRRKATSAQKANTENSEKSETKIDPKSIVASKQKEEATDTAPKRGWWQKSNG
ncbi:ribonuclease E/G [Hyphomicrobiales bacterium 4NK60-0047b]